MPAFTSSDSFLRNSNKTWSYSTPNSDTMRFEVRGGDYYDNPLAPPELDDEAQGKNRSEISSLKYTQYGRKFTLDFDFQVESGAANNAPWLLLAQFHQTEDKNPDGSSKDGPASPPFAVQMRGERLEITGRTDPNPVTLSTPERIAVPPYNTPATNTLYLDSNPLPRDTWINLRIEIVFDYNVGGSGMLKVWRDNVQIVDYSGPIGYNDTVAPYLQMGVYRGATSETFAAQFRDVTYTGAGDPPPINGTAGDDDLQANLVGFFEDEVLNGYGGNDTLNGGVGADTMNGGAGNDEYFVDNVNDVVNEREGGADAGGHDQIKTWVTRTMEAEIEDLLMLGDGNIAATGNAKANRIQGNSGNNTISGLGGDDELLANGGNDSVDGGAGNDTVHGDIGNDTVLGGTGNDEVYGDAGNDSLLGGAGNDTLYGGTGQNTLAGGAGDDVYVIENATDVISEGVGDGTDTVRSAVSFDAGAANSIEIVNTIDVRGTQAINLIATDGDNEVRGNDGVNRLQGRGGNDLLQGYAGNDTLIGDAGNDTLTGGAGVDSMVGGAGNDQYDVDAVGETVVEAAGGGSDTVRASANFDAGLTNEIEVINATDTSLTTALNLSGSNTNNEIRGTNGENVLLGRGGNDLLQGYAGDDTLDGGDGNDTAFGGAGNDSLSGGAGADSLSGEAGDDTVDAGSGANTVFGGDGNDSITAGDNNDSLLGQDGQDTILGGGGADTLFGGLGNDSMDGGAGTDNLSGNEGDDTLLGGAGSDTLFGGTGRDSLEGGDDADELYGNEGVDTLVGGGGDDILRGGTADIPDNGGEMRGGAGDDTYYVEAINTTIVETAGNGNDIVRTTVDVHLDASSDIEVLRVDNEASTNAVDLTGSDIDNELRGNAGANTLRGGAGNDTLRGFGGDDVYYVDSSTDVVIEAAGGGNDKILTETSYTLSSTMDIETVEVTPSASRVDVTLVGNQLNNRLVGANGDDSLVGNDGDDTLVAGEGNDTINGGAGNDTLVLADVKSTEVTATAGPTSMRLQTLLGEKVISNTVETIQFEDTTLTYTQASTLMTNIQLPTQLAGPDSLTGTEGADTLNGGGGADTLNGLGGDDKLYGGDDFDTLDGGAGNDSLYSGVGTGNGAEMRGGAGNDTYYVDADDSTITETAGNGTDVVRASVSFALAGDDDIETLQVHDQSTTNDIALTGSDIDNTVRGNEGDNTLDGGAGDDLMVGYGGDDLYFVRQAGDQVVEGQGQGRDTIRTGIDLQLGSTQFIEELRALDETSTTGMRLVGNNLDNDIYGTDGTDSLVGNGGNDRLFVHDGDDTVLGGAGVDEVVLDIASTQASGTLQGVRLLLQTPNGSKLISEDVERVVFTDQTLTYAEAAQLTSATAITGDLTGNNSLTGTAGDDVIYAGRGDDTVDGLGGNDLIFGDEGVDVLQGGAGNDTLHTGDGAGGTLAGGTGDDLFYVTAENTTVTEAASGGTDTIRTTVSVALAAGSQVENIQADNLSGIEGISLTGSNIVNTLRGNAGNNTLDGGAGADRMFGYGGDDVYHVDNAGDFTYESAGGGTDTVLTTVNRTLRSVDEIEVLRAADETSTTGMTLIGNGINNLIAGTDGADSLRGGDGDDTLVAHDGNDTIYGDAGTDVLQMDVNSTEVTGRLGGSLLVLYTQNGELRVHNSTEQIAFLDRTLSFAEATQLVSNNPVPSDPTGPNVLEGTPGADVLDGQGGNDTISGLGGNDDLRGSDGVDLLIGGDGNDILRSGASDDPNNGGEMRGGAGDDDYYVDAANVNIVETAGQGNDTVFTNFSVTLSADDEIEELRATDLNSTNVINLIGSNTDNLIRGNAGNNVLDGKGGADNMYGYAGDDVYYVDNAGDRINEWAGNGFDMIRTSVNFTLSSVHYIERLEVQGTAGLTLVGNQLAQGLFGGTGGDWLDGKGGDDTLVGGFGDDTLYGGDGTDRAVFEVASTQVTASAGATSFRLQSSEGNDFVHNSVEFLVFTDTILSYADASVLKATVGPAVPPINGTSATETLHGTAASEQINGLGGYDWIIPGRGNDTVDGGTGLDMVSYSDAPEVAGRGTNFMLDLDLGGGTAKIFGGETDQLISIERATGSIFADVMRGSDGNDEMRGLGDYDWFIATAGNDTLDGGNGQDMITFLEAASSGAAVVETVFSATGAPPSGAAVGGVTLNLSDPSQSTGLALGLTLNSVERVTGSSHQDVFYGDAQQNDFRGLGGYDWFVGSTGGRERYFGGDGLDTVTYFQSTSGVSASLRNGAGLFGGQETGYGSAGDAVRDLYFEIENLVGTNFDDSLTGNNERNQLSGLDGDDFLFGYGGTDYMKGGAGNDTLNGGAGSDFAVFDGNRGDYTITRSSATDVTVTGPDGTDSLISVEYFQFDDETANIWQFAIA
jgi:Ca2+-binding RTX toxin-like protein